MTLSVRQINFVLFNVLKLDRFFLDNLSKFHVVAELFKMRFLSTISNFFLKCGLSFLGESPFATTQAILTDCETRI